MNSKSYIGAIAKKQGDYNMQSHINENASTDKGELWFNAEEKEISAQNFKQFHRCVHNFLYHFFDKITDFEQIRHVFRFNEEELAKYLYNLNEEFLNSNDYTNSILQKKQTSIRKISEKEGTIYCDGDLNNQRTVKTSISFIPSISDDTSNIIRIEITEEIVPKKEYLHGSIDFCSNGQVIINDFSTAIYNSDNTKKVETKQSFLKDSSVAEELLISVQKYMMHVFEMSDLKTTNQSQKRK